jgi:hypothetical protein
MSLYPTRHINMSLINLSLSRILNQILSHGSYTKNTSQLYVQHHQHMPILSMYQNINLDHTKHQLCTTTCASTKHLNLYQTVHQPCTSTMYINTCTIPCTITCDNHACQPCISTMYIDHVYQPCTSTPYHIPIIFHTMYQSCTITSVSTIYHITLNHAMYHITISQKEASSICQYMLGS